MQTHKIQLLIADDEASQRELLANFFKQQGLDVHTVENGKLAFEYLQNHEVSMLISDIKMPEMDGLEALSKIRTIKPSLPVLLVTAFPDIKDAVTAMKDGALNYIEKPLDFEELLECVCHSTGIQPKTQSNLFSNKDLPQHIIAQSEAMLHVIQDCSIVADSDSRVLLSGDSGTGKEILADLLHQWSSRSDQPLIKVNCAAIPEALLESEFFGHEKGAFTGADQFRKGKFEEANSGTLFLDEISEMSPNLQAKLLRITQDGYFQRLGSNENLQCDVRLLAASNKDLEKEVSEGRFRQDLYYRLNVVEIHLRPLLERKADIAPLAQSFANSFLKGHARLSPTLIQILEHYHWPGNVRELKNAMERAALMSRGELILPEHLPPKIQNTKSEQSSSTSLESVERDAILKTLKENGYNRTRTAKALNISRRSLIYKLQSFKDQGHRIDQSP